MERREYRSGGTWSIEGVREEGTAPADFGHRTCRTRAAFVRMVEERGVSLIVVSDERRLSEKTRRAYRNDVKELS